MATTAVAAATTAGIVAAAVGTATPTVQLSPCPAVRETWYTPETSRMSAQARTPSYGRSRSTILWPRVVCKNDDAAGVQDGPSRQQTHTLLRPSLHTRTTAAGAITPTTRLSMMPLATRRNPKPSKRCLCGTGSMASNPSSPTLSAIMSAPWSRGFCNALASTQLSSMSYLTSL